MPCIVLFLTVACPGDAPCLDNIAWTDGLGTAWDIGVARLSTGQPVLSQWALFMLVLWLVAQAILERYLFAEVVPGVKLRDGSQLNYRINGHLAFWVTMAFLLGGYVRLAVPSGEGELSLTLSPFPLAVLDDRLLELAVAAIVVSVALSACLYAVSFASACDGGERLLAVNSGYFSYDFFMGRELNPRVRLPGQRLTDAFDLKVFCELRPGLIGWAVINLGMLFKHMQLNGGAVSAEMLSINLFQGLYVWDALYHERAILTTMVRPHLAPSD